MSLNSTDLEQIEVFKKLYRQLGEQLKTAEGLSSARDVREAVLEYKEVMAENGQEMPIDETATSPREYDAQIIFMLQSIRRTLHKGLRTIKEVKDRATGAPTNGAVPVAFTPPPPPEDAIGAEMEIIQEE